MKNETEFAAAMETFMEMFEKKLSKKIIKIYWQALKPYTDEECEYAFKDVFSTARFFPKPADIIEKIKDRITYIN
jgi:hypothetical protein